jgi:nucleoside-diphosphate-sugar epimerase
MAGNARATTFVTGSDGFLGTELVKLLVSRGHRVLALTRSVEGAEILRRIGAIAVIGDPSTPGRWQDEAAAEWVLHLATPLSRRRSFLKRTATMAQACLSLDANLLDAVSADVTRRIVYVADGTCYGAAGSRPITEDEPPRPSAAGRWLVPALDRLNGYLLTGLPIVTAIPGSVYGNGSWFQKLVMEPVKAGRRVLQFGSTGPLVSPIHVHDCVRALVHLVEHGKIGGRYFVANNAPVRAGEFAKTFARLARRPLRVCRLPAAASRFLAGSVCPEYPQTDAVLSNVRLRAVGFRLEYPTLEDGIGQILRASHE